MERAGERGIALIMTLILLAIISVMAVSFMFLSQSETWSTLNYRLMSQARDGAEAGVNAAANFLLNSNVSYPYLPPDTTGADLISDYTLTTFPVNYSNDPVILSANDDVSPNYPYSTAQDNFNTNGVGKGSLAAGGTTVNYATTATLLAMRNVEVYGGSFATVPTWLITSDATIDTGVRNATVQVTAILERPIVPTFSYAAFATSNQCAALTFSQAGTVVQSYDSAVTPAPGGILASNGNVGTNGNLTVASNATINGSLSTPAVGTGTCVNGATGASTAQTACAGCTVTGGVVELPQPVPYPPPVLPSPMPPLTNQSGNVDCGNMPNCTLNASKNVSLAPGTYGNLTIGSSMEEVHLTAGTYNLNTFKLGNASLIIDSGPVIFNVTGCATLNVGNTDCSTYILPPPASSLVVDLSSGAISNPSYNPLNFQIEYAGPGNINVKCGNTETAATIYAPNANITLSSNGTFYGSVIGGKVDVSSGGTIMYDRNLQETSYTVGNYVLGGFSWARF
ncbi:MAG: pilus assembly PilX N-terminal domain-containing protein [Acidobacteria bacterium]|nr:pilus assembly PilX N-terminal domain-containing protein [Acidobacteriota bacterium]